MDYNNKLLELIFIYKLYYNSILAQVNLYAVGEDGP